MAFRLRLPIPYHKATRLILPCCLLLAGLAIFISSLVRTYHVAKVVTKSSDEEQFVQTQNEHMEWWLGFPVMWCGVLAITAVIFDKPMLFKSCVFALGVCFILLVFGLLWDAGEFSWYARKIGHQRSLEDEGYDCNTIVNIWNYSGHVYTFRECECKLGNKHNFNMYLFNSCELALALFYVHGFLAFSLSCAIGLTLFTLFSFVLILKRISQITTALHLDEKPLSEDFGNLHGDLYMES